MNRLKCHLITKKTKQNINVCIHTLTPAGGDRLRQPPPRPPPSTTTTDHLQQPPQPPKATTNRNGSFTDSIVNELPIKCRNIKGCICLMNAYPSPAVIPSSTTPSEVLLRKSLKKMNAPKYRSLNGISNLPENVFESILTLMPIKDALRTSVLLKKWRYSWRSMPKLVFTSNMVKVPSDCGCGQLKKYKLVNAIFHVLLLHNGPSILEFDFSNNELQMDSEFDQILSHLSKGNNVKELALISFYHLPISFYSLQGLERIHLENCDFEPILTFNGFSRLRKMVFINVGISARMLQHFLSNCPLLEEVILRDYGGLDFAGEIKFTFVEFLQCVPLIKTLEISQYPMKLLAGAMPHELPTSLDHLKHLQLDMCIMEQDEISSALCMIRSSPVLEKMVLLMYNKKLPVRQIPNNFLDLENYSDLKLGHLETLEIEMSRKSPLVMDFVKLVMAKAPVLKKVRIQLRGGVSVDDELKMLRGLIRLPFRRASPYAKFIVERYKASE